MLVAKPFRWLRLIGRVLWRGGNVAAAAALSDARLNAEMELVGAVTARDNFAAEIKELRARLASRQAGNG